MVDSVVVVVFQPKSEYTKNLVETQQRQQNQPIPADTMDHMFQETKIRLPTPYPRSPACTSPVSRNILVSQAPRPPESIMISSVDTTFDMVPDCQSHDQPKDSRINQIDDDSASNQECLSSIEQVADSFTDEMPQYNIARVLDSNYTQSQEQYPPATHCSPNQDENPNLIPEFQAKPRRDTNPYINPNVPTSHQGISATQTTQVPFLGLTPV